MLSITLQEKLSRMGGYFTAIFKKIILPIRQRQVKALLIIASTKSQLYQSCTM
jgi:hypothetical protein